MLASKKKSLFASFITAFILGVVPPLLSVSSYEVTPLIANQDGKAPNVDKNLRNSWGIFFVPNGQFWVADNAADLATLYDPDGRIINFILEANASPTGALLNLTDNFLIGNVGNKHPADFLVATETGTILGFNNDVNPLSFVVAADRSFFGSIYKGLTQVESLLFATDFHNGKIDVFDSAFNFLFSLKDDTLPSDFAPFNIKNINGLLYVTYAKQLPPDNVDDQAGKGNGYVNVYTPTGDFVKRLVSQGKLNSPWGLALAPDTFGDFSGALLVGNQGDGSINAFDADTGAFLGRLKDAQGDPLKIPRLWSLAFDSQGTLYYTSGPQNEKNGIVGKIVMVP